MNEKKKIIVLLSIIAAIVLIIIGGSLYENHKSNAYLDEFYEALNGSENKLVMIGRDNCSWCQLFHPILDFMSENYDFEFIYVNTNELTSSSLKKMLKSIDVDVSSFGTPLTVVVKDGEVIDSINGYVDEISVMEFLKDNSFVSSDIELPLNYVDYSHYKKLVKADSSSIIVIGQTSCTYCIKAKPILDQIAIDYDININYLNITELTEDELSKFYDSLDYLKNNEWGTPLTLIVKKGEVIDSANGLLDYNGYVELFKTNGFIK